MRHWLQLATRNWWANPGRVIASAIAVSLGVATVVAVTCFYESVRVAIEDQIVGKWVGKSHLTVEPPLSHWGSISQALVEPLSAIDNVDRAGCRLQRVMTAILSQPDENLAAHRVDAIGIDAESDSVFREYRGLVGRLIQPGERGVVVIENAAVGEWGLGIGDTLQMAVNDDRPPREFSIVGSYDVRRIAEFQRPTVLLPLRDLQELKSELQKVTVIDLKLKDTSPDAMKKTTHAVRARVTELNKKFHENSQVASSAAKLEQLAEAEQVTRMVLTLVAFVALLTSFFIILTTMSMGFMEKMSTLGAMRCLGVTRSQMACLVAAEVLPVGLIAVLAGIPLGLGLTYWGASMVPDYIQGVVISSWGMWLAIGGGLITTLIAAGFLVLQVGWVTPLEATKPEANPTWNGWAIIVALVGVASLMVHRAMVEKLEPGLWLQEGSAFAGLATLYLGYVMIIPFLVLTVGTVAVHLGAFMLGIEPKLARDQVGRAPWRSAAICWMLMVGLSLIVYIGVRAESVSSAWDFPKKLPSTFIWNPDGFPLAVRDGVLAVPGVTDATFIRDFPVKVGDPQKEATSFLESIKRKMKNPVPATFVAGELDKFLAMTKLGFLEGNIDDAIDKLQKGGYVLLPPESSRSYDLHLGDKVTLSVGRRPTEFEVAGVVESPALDIAVTFFGADSYMMLAAAGSFLGTLEDAQRCFGVHNLTLALVNIEIGKFDIPDLFHASTPPATDRLSVAKNILAWKDRLPNEAEMFEAFQERLQAFAEGSAPDLQTSVQLRRLSVAMADIAHRWDRMTPQIRWDAFTEELVLRSISYEVGNLYAMTGSLRQLKQLVDQEVRQATLLMSAMPAVALIVAAMGVANLMMANVNARRRQIAVIRAVGGTKSQIVRLILVEAIALGMLGIVAGIALGFHAADSANQVTANLFGFESPMVVPWGRVIAAAAFTLVVCVCSGIGPARRAARSNIVEAISSV